MCKPDPLTFSVPSTTCGNVSSCPINLQCSFPTCCNQTTVLSTFKEYPLNSSMLRRVLARLESWTSQKRQNVWTVGVTGLCEVNVVITGLSSPLYVYRNWQFKTSPFTLVFVLYLLSELTDLSIYWSVTSAVCLSALPSLCHADVLPRGNYGKGPFFFIFLIMDMEKLPPILFRLINYIVMENIH